MGFLKRVFKWLLLKPRRVARYGNPSLYAINIEKIAQEINLEAEARRLAESNLPKTDETALTGVESQIIRRIEKARQDYSSWAVDRRKVLNETIENCDVAPLINKALQVDNEFERKASELLSQNEQVLKETAENAYYLDIELDRVRAQNALQRQAFYPDVTRKFLKWSILILLIVIEGILNAVFFAKGISTGLIGGFVYAASFSFVNVFLAYLWGRFAIPNCNHIKLIRQYFGAFSVLAALATAIGIGLLIAHFRDALGSDLANAPRMALESLRQEPLGLQEVHSWILFGISVVFALIALGDAYSMDDPYPGYGAISRRARQAFDDYITELGGVRDALQELKDRALDELDKTLSQCQSDLRILNEMIEHKVATETHLRNALADADNCLGTLLRTFRDINQLHRKNRKPLYFGEDPKIKEIKWPDFSVDHDRFKYKEQSSLVDQLIRRVQEIRGNIQSSFIRHHDGLKPLDEHFNTVKRDEYCNTPKGKAA